MPFKDRGKRKGVNVLLLPGEAVPLGPIRNARSVRVSRRTEWPRRAIRFTPGCRTRTLASRSSGTS
jgi:hypothetical protein